ncbi:MAG: insulinase family protein [Myxococcales bacterium]|nr:insulinase family protein [Myxococcales bacterium]
MMRRSIRWALALPLFVACSSTPPVVATAPVASTTTPPPVASSAPPAKPTVDVPPPAAARPMKPAQVVAVENKSAFGSATAIVSATLPIVYVRVMVDVGIGHAQNTPTKSAAAIASMTGDMLKDGGAGKWSGKELAEQIDALGADLTVDTGMDRTILGIAVTKDKLDAALDVLGAVLAKPRFDKKEFAKLKARELDRVRQAQKGSGGWMARQALYRTLLDGTRYAMPDATEATLAGIELDDLKAYYGKAYRRGQIHVVVAGDVDATKLGAALDGKLGGLPAGATAMVFPAPPAPTAGIRVVLAKKPGSKQADIFVARRVIARNDPRFPDLALATHVLGGGMAMRLFSDVREKRSLAYSTNANVRELAWGSDSLVALYAGTQTALAGKSVDALLEHLRWISKDKPVTQEEFDIARTSLETAFLYRLETIGAVGGLALEQKLLKLPGADVYDYVEKYRAAIRGATLASVRAAAADLLAPSNLVIAVAGDPSLAGPLSHFGAVTIVDPEKNFEKVGEKAADPSAPLAVGP